MKPTQTDNLLAKMLTENTGAAMCDSGGVYGRNWEHNRAKTVEDFMTEPSVKAEFYEDSFDYYLISVFHYLRNQLDLDAICNEFNQANENPADWDDDRIHGVSAKAGEILDNYNAEIQQSGFNSYNGETALSQVIQGTYVQIAGNGYVALQIHGGCDVRGGYTDAKLFKIENGYGDVDFDCLAPEEVYGMLNNKEISNTYNGYSLTDENDNEIENIKKTDKLVLWLAEY